MSDIHPVWTILAPVVAFFSLTATTYYLTLAIPSIFLLTPMAMNFAILGVMGLAVTSEVILYTLEQESLGGAMLCILGSPFFGLIGSLLYAIPFFIAIACGAPAFITTSYLSWSAANIAVLTYASLFFLGFIISFASNSGDISTSSSEFYVGGKFKSFNSFQPQEPHGNGYNRLI